MADYPQHAGNVKLSVSPGKGQLVIDDYEIGQFVTNVKLLFDAKNRRPVLLLDLLPASVEVQGDGVKTEFSTETRDFLISLGWRPPELVVSAVTAVRPTTLSQPP